MLQIENRDRTVFYNLLVNQQQTYLPLTTDIIDRDMFLSCGKELPKTFYVQGRVTRRTYNAYMEIIAGKWIVYYNGYLLEVETDSIFKGFAKVKRILFYVALHKDYYNDSNQNISNYIVVVDSKFLTSEYKSVKLKYQKFLKTFIEDSSGQLLVKNAMDFMTNPLYSLKYDARIYRLEERKEEAIKLLRGWLKIPEPLPILPEPIPEPTTVISGTTDEFTEDDLYKQLLTYEHQ